MEDRVTRYVQRYLDIFNNDYNIKFYEDTYDTDSYFENGKYSKYSIGDKLEFQQDTYTLLYQLSMGNNSIIWLAFDHQRNIICVFKVYRRQKANKCDVDDFFLSKLAGMNYIYKRYQVYCNEGGNKKKNKSKSKNKKDKKVDTFNVMDVFGPNLDQLTDEFIKKDSYMNINLIKKLFQQIAQQYKQIQDNGVIHADIKLDNIVISNIDQQKFTDNFFQYWENEQNKDNFVFPLSMKHIYVEKFGGSIEKTQYSSTIESSSQYSDTESSLQDSIENSTSFDQQESEKSIEQSAQRSTQQNTQQSTQISKKMYIQWIFGFKVEINKDIQLQIIDFGNSVKIQDRQPEDIEHHPKQCRSIDIFEGLPIQRKSDLHPLACVLYELVVFRDLFKDGDPKDIVNQILFHQRSKYELNDIPHIQFQGNEYKNIRKMLDKCDCEEHKQKNTYHISVQSGHQKEISQILYKKGVTTKENCSIIEDIIKDMIDLDIENRPEIDQILKKLQILYI